MLLTRSGLEQATAELVARHRAARFGGVSGTVLDLCCGIGGDLAAIATVVDGLVAGVDHDELHAICTRHNAKVYRADNAAVVVSDVLDVRVDHAEAVFVDPARRAGDRRGGSSPSLEWCVGLPVDKVCVKTAPGVDKDVVPHGWEIEFVADHRALKEAVLWSPAWATATTRATVLPAGDSLVADPGCAPAAVRGPGRYLLDPSPAVTRAGAVADLAQQLGAWQVDPQIAFLSADQPMHSPFGRSLRVEASMPFAVKALTAELRRLGIGRVEIRRRGLAGDADELKKRLRTEGTRVATVVLTRVVNKPWAFVCTDLESP